MSDLEVPQEIVVIVHGVVICVPLHFLRRNTTLSDTPLCQPKPEVTDHPTDLSATRFPPFPEIPLQLFSYGLNIPRDDVIITLAPPQ